MPLKKIPSILIIDDQPDSISLLIAYLKQFDFDISVALSGKDGLKIAVEQQPDLILQDIFMPEINGYDVCQRLKLNPLTKDIPVIFLSAGNGVDEKLQGFAAGGTDYITKPYDAAEVLARIFVQLQSLRRLAKLESMVVHRAMEGIEDAGNRYGRIFADAARILIDDLADFPGLQELSRRVGTNERKLTEIFRDRVGMTVFEYLTDLRMETAKGLLENGDFQIKLIAERVGYRNAGDFSRAFRQRYQLSPREYRQIRSIYATNEQ